MEKNEFAELVAMIKTFYSKEETLLNTPEAIEMWYRMLKDIPAQAIKLFLTKWFATEKWSPSVADIRQGCSEIVNGEKLDWGTAWGEVMRAIQHYGYMRQGDALASMSENTRRAVECIGWNEICMCENTDTMRAQFRQIYETQSQRAKVQQALPDNVKQAIAGIQMQALPEAKDGI